MTIDGAAKDDRALVLLRGALGDTLISLPFLAALPNHFQVRKLSLAGNPPYLELLANQPFVASIHDHNRAGWSGLYLNPPDVPDRLAAFISGHGAGVVLARSSDDPAAAGLRHLGLKQVLTVPSYPQGDTPVHVVEAMYAATGVRPLEKPVLIRPTDQGLDQAKQFLTSKGLGSKPWLALHPGSGGAHKNWPIENWTVLAGEIERKTGLAVLFLLGPAEEDLAARIAAGYQDHPSFRIAPCLPLPVVAGLLTLGRGYIGHDSGPTHLAAGLGRPTLALFGTTDPAHWAPRGPDVTIISQTGLTPDHILGHISRWRDV